MSDLNPSYFVNVGSNGTFKKSGNYYTTPTQVDELFDFIEVQNRQKIVLYFHGGLVSEGRGLETAKTIQDVFANTECHPVTFVWETGLIETVQQRLNEINSSSFFKNILTKVLKASGNKLGKQSNRKGLLNLTNQEIEIELQKEEPFSDFITETKNNSRGYGNLENVDEEILYDDVYASLDNDIQEDNTIKGTLNNEISEDKFLDIDKVASTPNKGAKGLISSAKLAAALARVTIRVIKRHLKKIDHGFYPTVIEEMLRELYLADAGAWVWDGMKAKALSMWNSNNNLTGEEMHAGTYFIEKLSAHIKKHPETKINLVGHSAGAIVICNLLNVVSVRHPEIKFGNIVFLAPACTVDKFCEDLIPRTSRFEKFRMFTMNDKYEIKDRLVQGLYTRSLLYFISGVLENKDDKPILGLHRHITGLPPYTTGNTRVAHDYLFESGTDRAVLSVTKPEALDGLHCASESHGFFDNDPHVHRSLTHLLA